MKKTATNYPHVFPKREDWPIYKLSQDREKFVKEINAATMERLMHAHGKDIGDIIAKTMYLEKIRIKEEPWKVDPPNEKQFWKKIRARLLKISPATHSPEEQLNEKKNILRTIINRYTEEIVGVFKIKTFNFVEKFLTFFFNSLLYGRFSIRSLFLEAGKKRLKERLIVEGHIDEIRTLMNKGIVVVVPTHFSNLDSILIGYALNLIGLPSFSYGAGLNLFNSDFAAYFMNRLGAYRLDRRKKNPIYLETLKIMSKLSIERGTNSLFFPGGTRSRSGAVENKFKLGLLGTAVEAQRQLYQDGKSEKIYVVPIVLGYHFVLEAKQLIEQHLTKIGKEKYIKSKEGFGGSRKFLRFLRRVLFKGNDIVVSVGQPMDVIGNPVDTEGNSYDNFGKLIKVKDYFMLNGTISTDLQREREYTRILGEEIIKGYKKYDIVLSSHLLAFAVFNFLKQQKAKLDLFGILRLPPSDYVFPMEELREVISKLQEILIEMEREGQLKLSPIIRGNIDELIMDGIKRVGNFHAYKPLKLNKKGQVVSENFKLLYYYHNRLDHYGLEKKIQWSLYEMDLI